MVIMFTRCSFNSWINLEKARCLELLIHAEDAVCQ